MGSNEALQTKTIRINSAECLGLLVTKLSEISGECFFDFSEVEGRRQYVLPRARDNSATQLPLHLHLPAPGGPDRSHTILTGILYYFYLLNLLILFNQLTMKLNS